METGNREEVLIQTLNLLDTAKQASLELLQLYKNENYELAQTMQDDLKVVLDVAKNTKTLFEKELKNAYISEFIENIEDTLNTMEENLKKKELSMVLADVEYRLFPFLSQLWEAFYFWGIIYQDSEKLQKYYEEEFILHYQNPYLEEGKPARYKASVVVVGYNHLDITKRCVESILKYTDFEALNAELVLVDNGSTDGTLEYFEGLGIGRIIHFKANMRGVSFCILPRLCDSEYYVHVANDIAVTKDWLDILLTCMQSDSNIALAVPATCNMSNLQSIHVPFTEYNDVITYANQHNKSNPKLWRERVRVLPAMAVFSSRILNKIGFWDPFFYTFDFIDDDFSLRVRRAGYKQLLCEDVICYHQGSATVRKEQQKENLLEVGRKLFISKHKVDPWGNGFCFDMKMLSMLVLPKEQDVTVLGIDCGYGDTILQLCNELKEKGYITKKYYITTEEEYLPDLTGQTENVLKCEAAYIHKEILKAFEEQKFSIVCIGTDIAKYYDQKELLHSIAKRLKQNGQVLFAVENPYFAINIQKIIQFSLYEEEKKLVSPSKIVKYAKEVFKDVSAITDKRNINGIEEFILQHYGNNVDDTVKKRLEVLKYYISCINY